MRHKKNFNHLGRKRGHRKAMLSNMASSLIMHKRIKTTTAKAKALRVYVEPIITKAKEDTTHSRRVAFRYLQDKEAANELFREVAVKVGDRPGGYTRIIKLGARLGDAAEMCIIELVDYNENMLADKAVAAKSSRRRRGAKKKSDGDSTVATEVAETAVDTESTEAEVVESTEAEPVADEKVEETPAEEKAEEKAPVKEETEAKEDKPTDAEEKKAE